MSLTKEECRESYEVIDILLHLICGEKREDGYEPTMDEMVSSMKTLKQLINEHFDNPPLKFEELKEGMWVWDDKYKTYYTIKNIRFKNDTANIYAIYKRFAVNTITNENEVDVGWMGIFEENRFFIRQVRDDAKRTD